MGSVQCTNIRRVLTKAIELEYVFKNFIQLLDAYNYNIKMLMIRGKYVFVVERKGRGGGNKKRVSHDNICNRDYNAEFPPQINATQCCVKYLEDIRVFNILLIRQCLSERSITNTLSPSVSGISFILHTKGLISWLERIKSRLQRR